MGGDKMSSRRQFLNRAAAASAFAGGLAGASPVTNGKESRLPREVWVAAMGHFGFQAKDPREMCRAMLKRMEETLPMQPDIICTPEVFAFSGLSTRQHAPLAEIAEERSGPVIDQFAAFARQHHCYVICSTYTKEAGHCYISLRTARPAGQVYGRVSQSQSHRRRDGVGRHAGVARSAGFPDGFRDYRYPDLL
jgi:hypothetical protein